MRSLDISFDDYVFVDFGSGKGRTLLLAAEAGFKRCEGVEFSAELNRVARSNLQAYRSGRFADKVIIHDMDAAQYTVPDDEPCVIYLYNPFGGPVFSAVLERIIDSWKRRPRDMWIIYLNPKLASRVEQTGIFHRCARRIPHRVRDLYLLPEPLAIYRARGEPGR